MLDPEKAGAWLEHHFATVTPEEFIANVRRASPESARMLWGDLSTADILARGDHSRAGNRDVFGHDCDARLQGSSEESMVDPERARAVLREYHATASDQQIVDDLWRHSPELARRLGVAPPSPARHASPKSGRVRDFFSSFHRSVLRLFS